MGTGGFACAQTSAGSFWTWRPPYWVCSQKALLNTKSPWALTRSLPWPEQVVLAQPPSTRFLLFSAASNSLLFSQPQLSSDTKLPSKRRSSIPVASIFCLEDGPETDLKGLINFWSLETGTGRRKTQNKTVPRNHPATDSEIYRPCREVEEHREHMLAILILLALHVAWPSGFLISDMKDVPILRRCLEPQTSQYIHRCQPNEGAPEHSLLALIFHLQLPRW